eukprot:CAMPEP_0119344838 /NCGR_PEP_ID=MMETSP1333-20130426/107176_1 /TAXON_ID=418940 /ORGANISM="Scyphosphaera apsteinii, Strain RCC1455" /LENGTH=270 /DNA_ID=CAMNT_0007357287 /DNA_START=70 /DNA_END=882 /DNA_ORIENTATION=-
MHEFAAPEAPLGAATSASGRVLKQAERMNATACWGKEEQAEDEDPDPANYGQCWTEEEERLLAEGVAEFGGTGRKNWKESWTEEEERLLAEGVAELGGTGRKNWKEVSKRLPGRSCNAIKSHWRDKLISRLKQARSGEKEAPVALRGNAATLAGKKRANDSANASSTPHKDRSGDEVEAECTASKKRSRPMAILDTSPASQPGNCAGTSLSSTASLIEKVQHVARELGLDAALPNIPDVLAQANAMFSIQPSLGATATEQADALLAQIGF